MMRLTASTGVFLELDTLSNTILLVLSMFLGVHRRATAVWIPRETHAIGFIVHIGEHSELDAPNNGWLKFILLS